MEIAPVKKPGFLKKPGLWDTTHRPPKIIKKIEAKNNGSYP